MSELQTAMVNKAKELLNGGEIKRIVGWKKGEFFHDPSPATFETEDSLKEFVYNDFCGANLSKYLIDINKKEGKTAVFLKPCDTYSFNELIKEHRITRENFYVIGTECHGKLDNRKLLNLGIDGVTDEKYEDNNVKLQTLYGEKVVSKGEAILERCLTCKGKKFVVFDETIVIDNTEDPVLDRFSKVKEIENMSADERFKFWQGELSKCLRCNACRNVCPACSCTKCVFDNPQSGIAAKANDVSFEEQLFHVIRAFHVAGRCTDCGECSRVCPQSIPLHLLNRKFIKDADILYGEFKAGETADGKTPLTQFSTDDIDPNLAADAVRK